MLVGQKPFATSLVTGIFNSWQPQPSYIFFGDFHVVLNFIKKDWGISSSMTHQKLTYKVLLLSLTTASHVSGL